MELLWENKIDYKVDDEFRNEITKSKISFILLIKKYFSKKIRVFFSKLKTK